MIHCQCMVLNYNPLPFIVDDSGGLSAVIRHAGFLSRASREISTTPLHSLMAEI
jgi:hypothetical protein